MFYSLWLLSRLFLYLWFFFLQFEYAMPMCSLLLAVVFLGVLWASRNHDFVSDITLGEILSHYCLKYVFYSFLSAPSGIPTMLMPPFCSCPTVLGCSGFYFFGLFSSCFFIWDASTDLSSSSETPLFSLLCCFSNSAKGAESSHTCCPYLLLPLLLAALIIFMVSA